ncbi:MAG TPA: family 20 glycosylhydrolase [Nitrospira sp.]|nr:family 20 glycosylhydrolase [Nitrospira sp.]
MSRVGGLVCVLVALWAGVGSGYAAAESSSGAGEETMRIMHVVLAGAVPLERARGLVNEAQAAGFTAIQVLLTDGVQFERAPWKPAKGAWSKAEFLSWVAYARAHGLEVIPEVKLLTHQEQFFQKRQPHLMFNTVSYDPRKDATYTVVFAFLDEVIEALHPKAIHIGHDEAFGWTVGQVSKWLKLGEVMIPAELFVQDVRRLHAYLTAKGVATWMWADMLLSPTEFPGIPPRYLHGVADGYGKPLRQQLPRDIVMCEWHYGEEAVQFPSIAVMQGEGFRVIGATWKREVTTRNFIRYALSRHVYGLMATTGTHVQQNDSDLVSWIIQASGALFRNPDAVVPPMPAPVGASEGKG